MPGPAFSVYSMVNEHEVTALHFTRERGGEGVSGVSGRT